MLKSKIKYSILILLLALLCSSGCNKYRQIRPLSAGVESIVPEGFRRAVVLLNVEVDNPASQLTISDVEGAVFHSGTILVTSPSTLLFSRQRHLTNTVLGWFLPWPMVQLYGT